MKRFVVYYVAGTGGGFNLDQGKIRVPKGKRLAGLRCRVTGYLKNTSGAGFAPSFSDKLAIIAHFLGSITLKYMNGKRVPYTTVDATKVRRMMRYLMGVEVSGWTDATNGLGKNLGAGSLQQAVTFTIVFPFQAPWFMEDAKPGDFSMGPTQALDLQGEFKRSNGLTALAGQAALTNGLALDTNQASYEFLPDLVDSPEGDTYHEVPHYVEKPEKALTTVGPIGLHFGVLEQTAPQATCPLSEYTLKIGETEIHENANPQWVREAELDTVNFPAGSDIADTDTVLYRPRIYDSMKSLPVGAPFINQPKGELSGGINAAYIFVPPLDEDSASAATVRSAELRGEAIKSIPAHVYRGESIPDSFQPYQAMVLKGANNRAFHSMHGLMAAKNSPRALPHTPPALAAAAKRKLALARASGDEGHAAHEERAIKKAVASAIPGGINQFGEASAHLRDHLHEVVTAIG